MNIRGEAAGGETEQPSTKRSPENARWRLRALVLFAFCETHSSGVTRREQSLLTAPVRIAVVSSVVGDLEPASPVGLDRPDLTVGSGDVVFIGYLLTGRRVGRVVVVGGVVGDLEPVSPVGLDRVDLFVVSGVVGKCYPLAVGSVVGVVVVRGVVSDWLPASPADIDRVDL